MMSVERYTNKKIRIAIKRTLREDKGRRRIIRTDGVKIEKNEFAQANSTR